MLPFILCSSDSDIRLRLPDGCIYDASEAKRVKYAYDHGHQVASHTWAHKDLTKLTWNQSTSQLYPSCSIADLTFTTSSR
jgi:hypothetical protein